MKKIICAVMMLLMLGMLAGCGSDKAGGAKKELIVGTEPGFAPFEFQDEKTKDYTGFDMDLVRLLAKQMGYEKCTIASMGFDALIPALDANNIDLIAAGMTITEERAKKVNFSKSYYNAGLVVMVKKNNDTIKGIDDLAGKRVAAQIGTTGAIHAAKVPGATVKDFNTYPDAFLELKNDGIDGVIIDLPVAQWYLKNGGDADAKIVGELIVAEATGMAANKKNPELITKLNKALDEVKANGEYDKLYTKWFGEAPKGAK